MQVQNLKSERYGRENSHADVMVQEEASRPVAVIGAGLAGLAAGQELVRRGIPVEIYEAGNEVGGLARTFRDDEGFIYDIGGHFLTSRLAKAAGIEQDCRIVQHYGETVLLRGKTYGYPFGLMTSPRFALSGVRARMESVLGAASSPVHAAQAFRQAYGDAMADQVALPLLEAWSGAPATELAPSVLDKMPVSLIRTMVMKVANKFTRRTVAIGYSIDRPERDRFHVYPREGLSVLSNSLSQGLAAMTHVRTPVEAVIVEEGRVVAVRIAGRKIPVAGVVSTVPINLLAQLVEGSDAFRCYANFRYRPMIFVTMRFAVQRLLQDVFVWTPEPKFPFFRLTEATISMPWLAPEGKTYISADIGCDVGDTWWCMAEDEIVERCLSAMERVYPDVRQMYLGANVLRTKVSYPVYLRSYEEDRLRLAHGTGIAGLYSVGRQGTFSHLPMEDVFFRTQAAMRQVAEWVEHTTPR